MAQMQWLDAEEHEPLIDCDGRQSATSSYLYETEMDNEELYMNMLDDDDYNDNTGIIVYHRACERLGVIPVKRFLDGLNGKEIVVTHRSLGTYGSKAIAAALLINASITTLDLSHNMIGDKGLNYIASALIDKDLVTTLVLAGNNFTKASAEVFAEFLERSKTLRELNLAGNEFDDKDCVLLAESLKHNKVLQELDLSRNKLTQKAGAALGEALAMNTSLQRLKLGWNQLGGNGVVALATGLADNDGLKALDLSWNGVDDAGACALARVLETNSWLLELQLLSNRITDIGLLEIVKVLELCGLQTIDVSRNTFLGANNAVEMLLELLLQGSEAVRLNNVNLGQIPLSKKSEELLTELKEARPDVTIHHGYVVDGSYQATLPKNIDPREILARFAVSHGTSPFQLFRSLGSTDAFRQSIPSTEFESGLKKLNLFTDCQIRELVEYLDNENNGVIDYSEFMGIFVCEDSSEK